MSSIAMITGASGGIGHALTRQLRDQGYRVAAVGREASRLDAVEADVRIAADTTTHCAVEVHTHHLAVGLRARAVQRRDQGAAYAVGQQRGCAAHGLLARSKGHPGAFGSC